MITPSMYDAIERLREPFDREPPDWIKRRKEADRIMAISTAGSSPTRDWMEKELKHTIAITESIINKIDKKENNNMKNRFATNDFNPKYQEIKDDLEVTSMTIENSPYAAPTVKIEGYIPLSLTVKDKNKSRNEPKVPQCKGIIRRDNTTRVDWADGTRTVIVLEEGREDMDMFHTFCIAFTKKMLGSTTAILNTIKECDTDAVEAAKKKAEEEKFKMQLEETKKLKAEMEAAAFEKAVQEKMFEERVIEEAIRRISIQEERRMNREAGEDDSEDCHGISIERFAEVFRKVMGHDKEFKESTDEA